MSCICKSSPCPLEITYENLYNDKLLKSTPRKQLTLAFLTRETSQGMQVLLGLKKRGFGKDKYNGFGGKIDPMESIVEGAKREFLEESGVELVDPKYRGQIWFQFDGKPEILVCHIFIARHAKGEAIETEEMKPKWFDIHDIPFDNMWPDDKIWLKELLLSDTELVLWYFLFQGHDDFLEPCFRSLPDASLARVTLDPRAILVKQVQTSMGEQYGKDTAVKA